MPLIHGKSKKSLQKNIKTEMEANPGKEHRAQNLAIAYSVQRKAKGKKMAKGGLVDKIDHDEKHLMHSDEPASPKEQPSREYDEKDPMKHGTAPHPMKMMAEGGRVAMEEGKGPEEDMEPMVPKAMHNEAAEHYDSIADAILSKNRKAKHLAEGGMVDLDDNQHEAEHHNSPDWEAEDYGEDVEHSMDQPIDSNEFGDEREDESENKHDMVSSIMRKMKSKRR